MRIVLLAIGGLVTAVVVIVLVSGVLIVTGSPSACVDRVVPVDAAAARALDANWDAFKAQALAGPATITITETQATSRGVEYLDAEDVPIDDLQIYFCPGGYAEATGSIGVAGLDADVLIRGTLDLSGDVPEIDIQKVKAGGLPSFLSDRVVDIVLSSDQARKLDELDVHLTSIQYTVDGTAVVSGGPP